MRTGLTAVVSGRVQGVMYRDFARRKALSLGLTGEAENLIDGTVRIYAEGEEDSLMTFMEFLKKGTLFASVTDVAYQLVHPRGGYETFIIRYN